MSETSEVFTVKSNAVAPAATSVEPTVLDQLKAVVSKKVERPEVQIDVPERPGVTLLISPNVSQHQLKSWRKNAGEDSKNGMDTVKFAAYVVGHTTRAIMMNGETVRDAQGYEVNFASPDILEMTQTRRPVPDCVIAFFGIEPHVEAAAVAIMEAAGYGDSIDAVDPTSTPTTN